MRMSGELASNGTCKPAVRLLRMTTHLSTGRPPADSSLEAGPCFQRAAVPGERILEDPLSANALFVQELRVLRLMVAPIRDREIRFAWITSRIERPVELRETVPGIEGVDRELKTAAR